MNRKIEEIKQKDTYKVDDLREIMEILRAPGGCPWDREQTHKSIRRNLIEETYEVVEAVDKDDPVLMCEELGDLMLQVVFHARIAEEEDRFDLDDVADGICKKLILRHPHIFGDVKADTTEQVLTNWDNIKKVEKHQKSDREVLDAVSHSLPALIRADKLAGKAAKIGIETDSNEIAGLAGALCAMAIDGAPADDAERVFGELLYNVAAAAKKLGVDAEKALADQCDRVVMLANDSTSCEK